MINALIRKLGMDKSGQVLEAEARRLHIEVLCAEQESPTKEPGSVASAAKPGETLQVFVLRAFCQAQRAMKASEIAKRVRTLGYQTTSSPESLLFSVEHLLADDKLFRRAGKDRYELALPAAAMEQKGGVSQEPAPAPAAVTAE